MMNESAALGILVFKTTVTVLIVFSLAIGIYLLKLPSSYQKHQRRYLLHMSILELVYELVSVVLIYTWFYEVNVHKYMVLLVYSISLSWIALLILLTLDRFLEVRLNIKYNHYITHKCTNMVILGSWLYGLVCFITTFTIELKMHKDIDKSVKRYVILPSFVLLFLGLLFTYLYIYQQLRRAARRMPQSSRGQRKRKVTFIPLWIILSYIVLVVGPAVAYEVVLQASSTDRANTVSIIILFLNDYCCCSDFAKCAFEEAALSHPLYKSPSNWG